MPKAMVIVESPAKARTIERYLGKGYRVRACAGHIKDLPKKSLGVQIKKDFHPTYEVIEGKEKIVRNLKKEAAGMEEIYLAADPDREGEAICQHLAEELGGSRRKIHRVLFNEITRHAILEAFENPSSIDRRKVEAQQARRILDRLVGYKVSPLLWQKVRKGLSAGRVQTVALRLVVEREKEIRAFQPVEYWNFTARLRGATPPPFEAKAVKLGGKKFKISNREEADALLEDLRRQEFRVSAVRQKERRRRPVPPFITSTLQQEASRKLRFPVRKTMRVAQRLYEGVELGSGESVGLITYMRTDSSRIADSALGEVREFIAERYGKSYLPGKPVRYRSRKGAQDAHEAIRPTSVLRTPESVKPHLERDLFRLYELVWKRFVASQMETARFDQTEIDVEAGRTLLRAVGKVLKFEGFLKVYREGRDDAEPEKEGVLPRVEKGERLKVEKITPEQKFTQPPPRYSEATLVKALEEKGIGRPSTYSQIISVIVDREYVRREDSRFVPTEIGEIVVDLLVRHFEEIFRYDYTAHLEEELDGIESGRETWVETLRVFYQEFSKELQQAKREMKNLKKVEEPAGVECDKCGAPMVIKWGKFGRFIACSRFPQCKNTRELAPEGSGEDEQEVHCEKCGRPMVLRRGRYGAFLACSGYPECQSTRPVKDGKQEQGPAKELDEPCPKCGSNLVERQGRFGPFVACSNYPQCRFIKQETTGVSCPECGQGEVVRKRSRKGRTFYGCNRYPECKFVLWKKPVQRSCPECGAPYMLESRTKRQGLQHLCSNKECSYRESIEEEGIAAGSPAREGVR